MGASSESPRASRASPRTSRARVVEVGRLASADAALWDDICRTNPTLSNPFYSRAFAQAVADVRPHVLVCVLEREGMPVAFFPFQFADRVARVLGSAERVGGHLNDYFGLIARPGFQIEPRELLRLAGISQLAFTHLDDAQLSFGLSGGGRRTDGTRYDISKGCEEFWQDVQRRQKHFYADTFRKLRRLERDIGPLRFVRHTDDGGELERLIEAKRQQYRATKFDDPLVAPWTRRLLHRLVSSKEPLCTGVLSTLHAGDTWVATHFGLRCLKTLHLWFPVYNREASRYSPGRMLLKAIIDSGPSSGIELFDDGESNETQDEKVRLGNSFHHFHRGTWALPGARALLARADASVRWRSEWLLNKVTKGFSP
jgi:CelD/BcsL family acetyltransferase involved in cellulose biosynthesis